MGKMNIDIEVSAEIRQKIPGFRLGIVTAEKARVSKDCSEFDQYFKQLEHYLKTHYQNVPLSSNPVIGHVRRMYRKIGWEPTRYRPSSEALARRILQGKGLYRILNLVDLGNLVSARFHLPLGLYDFDKIEGSITVDVGKPEESYEGISKKEIHAKGKMILRDQKGIFGNPTADSKRTALTAETRNILAVFFTPPEIEKHYLDATLSQLMEYFSPYAQNMHKSVIKV